MTSDWYNGMSDAVPYSGAAAAVADVASAIPASAERDFAETVRHQTAFLQRQNFAGGSNNNVPIKIPAPPIKAAAPAHKSKKPKANKDSNKPKRPLSAYNIFFKEEREKMLAKIPDRPPEEIPKNNKNPNRFVEMILCGLSVAVDGSCCCCCVSPSSSLLLCSL